MKVKKEERTPPRQKRRCRRGSARVSCRVEIGAANRLARGGVRDCIDSGKKAIRDHVVAVDHVPLKLSVISGDLILDPHFVKGAPQATHNAIGFALRGRSVIAPVIRVPRHVEAAGAHKTHAIRLVDKGPKRIGEEGIIGSPVEQVCEVKATAPGLPFPIDVLGLPERLRSGIKGVVAVHVYGIALILREYVGRFGSDVAFAEPRTG